VTERVTEGALRATFADARSQPLWDGLAGLGVPTLVVRSGADAPLTDDDWDRYKHEIPWADLVEFTGSPHDLFRQDRLRYPEMVRVHIERAEAELGR
jgi:non-heme chloroperoxidase